MNEAEALKIIATKMAIDLSCNREKEEKYIAFLQKHNLKSGPSPEFLAKLNKEQRVELAAIFTNK